MITIEAVVPALSGKWYKFSKDWVVGDCVMWLGHDGVHGFLYGKQYTADEEMYKHKDDLQMWKCVKRIHKW